MLQFQPSKSELEIQRKHMIGNICAFLSLVESWGYVFDNEQKSKSNKIIIWKPGYIFNITLLKKE